MRLRESAIPQGTPKEGRGAMSCALKTARSAIDSKGEYRRLGAQEIKASSADTRTFQDSSQKKS
jgi:hypothetical protein